MVEPAVRVRGKVSILLEDCLRRHMLRQLHKKAPRANEAEKRIERLVVIQLTAINMRLAQRRHSEMDKSVLQALAAEPALICGSSFSLHIAPHQRINRPLKAGFRHSGQSSSHRTRGGHPQTMAAGRDPSAVLSRRDTPATGSRPTPR